MNAKVFSEAELVRELDLKRRAGAHIVFTNGCFDLLHVGHTRYLQAARGLGDVLVVGVNTDRSVRGLQKGSARPIVPESQRAEVIAALECVDYVVLFDEPDPYGLIRAVQPDVLVKGGTGSQNRSSDEKSWRIAVGASSQSRSSPAFRPPR